MQWNLPALRHADVEQLERATVRLGGRHEIDVLLSSLPLGQERLDGLLDRILGEDRAVDLHRRKRQLFHDLGVLDLGHRELFHVYRADPFDLVGPAGGSEAALQIVQRKARGLLGGEIEEHQAGGVRPGGKAPCISSCSS